MEYVCNYCKDRDVQPVAEGLATDLKLAIETGVVADTGIVPEYNHIEDPMNIHGRVNDVFEAIEAQKQILANGKVTQPSSGTASAAAASAAASTPSEGQTA